MNHSSAHLHCWHSWHSPVTVPQNVNILFPPPKRQNSFFPLNWLPLDLIFRPSYFLANTQIHSSFWVFGLHSRPQKVDNHVLAPLLWWRVDVTDKISRCRTHTHAHTHTTHTHTHAHTYTQTHKHTHTHTPTHTHKRVTLFLCMGYTYIYIYTYVYIFIYMCIYA